MLVLTRKPGQQLQIGEATLTVLEFRRGKVRLGITAPNSVPVLRSELVEAGPPPEREQPPAK